MKETETVEFKRSTSEIKDAVVSIAAMLNKHGRGELYFGIRNDGTIIDQDVSEKTLRDVSQAISNHIEPKVYPVVGTEKIDARDCIHITFEGDEAPYYAYGRVFMRVSDEDRRLSPGAIERLIIEKTDPRAFWDHQPSRIGPGSVIEKELVDFVQRANQAGRLDFKYSTRNATLNKLGLLEAGKLRRAGVVLFCDGDQLEVQMAVFAGTDKTTFLDIRQLKGPVFHVLRESELYLKSNITWRVEFGKLEREEIPEIPIKALREALVNSICHRDYRNPKGNEIAIFKDRIEIYNPGRFPEGLTPDDYIRGDERSVLRNPLIANMLYFSKDIEKWGSGLKRMYDECTSRNVDVEFKPLRTGFLTVFHRLPPTGKGLGEKLGDRLGEKLGENERKILSLLAENPHLSIPLIAEALDISTTAVEKNIKKLKEKGLLMRIGPAKGGHWAVRSAPHNR
jgi:ATP-dependent DNA helicase RecG